MRARDDVTEAQETRYKYLATRAGDYFRYGLHACHACGFSYNRPLPLLRNYDVWGETVGINWNTKRLRYGEQSGKVSILKEPNSCKRGQDPRKLLLGKLLSTRFVELVC